MLKLFVFILISVSLYSGQANAAACSPPNTSNCYTLQLHYTFSEGLNQNTTDVSGNGRNGTLLNSPTWVANGPNYYLDFNRANKTSVRSPSFIPPADGVVAFWLKVPPKSPVRRRIFGFDDGWEIRWESDNIMYLDINKTGTNDSIRTSSAITATNTWMHIAVVTSATDNTWSVYIDGVLDNNGSETLTARSNPQPLSIGTRTGSNDYLDGSIDDFRIYSGVLTPTEIAALAAQSPDCCLSYPYETDFEGANTEWTPDNDWAISSAGHTAWQARSGSKFLDNNPSEVDQELHRNHYVALNKPVYIPTNAVQPTLSYYYKAGIFSGQIYSMISTNGINWDTLETYTDRNNHDEYTKREVNLESYKGQTVQIRFRQYHNTGVGARLFVVDDFRIGDFQSDDYSYPYTNGFETANLREHFNYEGNWNSSQAHDGLWSPSEGSYFLDNNYNNENQVQYHDHYVTMNGFITLPSGSANPMISFDYLSDIFDGQVYLQIQEYGSTTWTYLKTFNEQLNHSPHTKYEYHLSNYLGKKVRFRFRQYWNSNNVNARAFSIDNIFVGELTDELPFPYTNDFETVAEKSQWYPDGDWGISTAHDSQWFPSSGNYFLDNNPDKEDQALHREHYATMSGYIPLPADSSHVVVSYDFLASIKNGQAYLYIQKLGESNWVALKTYTEQFNRKTYTQEEISLAAYAGEKVRFRFRQYWNSDAGARVFTVDNFQVKQANLEEYAYPYFNDFETPISTPTDNGQDQWQHIGDWGVSTAHDSDYIPKEGSYFLDNNVEYVDQANHREHYSTMKGFVQLPAAPANPIISFDYLSTIFDGQVYLQIQEEGSSTWTYLKTFTDQFNHTPYTKYEYNLSRYLGKKVRFRFRQYWYSDPGQRVFPIDNFFIGELTETLPFPYANDFETAEEQAQWYPDGDWNISSAHDSRWYPSSGSYFLDNNADNEDQANHREHFAAMSGYVPLPADSSNVVVSFDYLLNTFDGQFYIYIQKQGQSDWTYLKTYNEQFNRTGYTKDEISLAAYGGESVRFRFRQYHYSTTGSRVFAIDNFRIEEVTLEDYGYPYFNDFETPVSTPSVNGQDQWNNIGDWGVSKAHDTVYVPESGEYFLDNNIDNENQKDHREHYATMNGFVTLPAKPENPMLSFDYNTKVFGGQGYVQIQEFGSNTWRNLKTFNEVVNHTPYTKFEYFLGAYAGKKVRFRFRQYWYSDTRPAPNHQRVFSIDNVFIGELKDELPYPYVNTFETPAEQEEWQNEGDWAVTTTHDTKWYPKTGSYFLDGNADNEDQATHREHYATLSGYIPLPADTSNVVVSFNYLLNTFDGQPYIYIQKLGDDNWTYLRAYTSIYNHDGYMREEIPLTAYAGEKVRFRFRQYYYGTAGARVFGVDDFKVGEIDLPDYEYPYFNDFETETSSASINGRDHWDLQGDWNISTEHDTVYKAKNGSYFLDNNADYEDQANHRELFASMLGYVPIALDANSPQLSFWYKANVFGGFAYVYIQEKGSSTWKHLFTFSDQYNHDEYTKYYYDLSAYKGKSIRIRFRQYWYSDIGERVFTVDDFRIGDDDRVTLSYPYENTFETEAERADFIHDGDWGISQAHDTDYVPYEGDWFIDNNANFEEQQNHRQHYITLANYIQIPTDAVVPTLSFWYKANNFDGGSYLEIRRKNDTRWIGLYNFVEDKNHDEYVKFEAHLDAYKGDEVIIRFRQYWNSTVGERAFVVDNFRLGDLIQEQYVFPYFNNFDTDISTASTNGRDHWNTQHDWKISDQNTVTGSAASGDWFLDNNPDDEDQRRHYEQYANMHGFIPIPASAVNPKVSFDYQSNLLGGYAYLQIQKAGSSTWTYLKTFSTNDNTAVYKNYSRSLTDYKGESVRFRFRQHYNSTAGERVFNVDNFTVDQELLGIWYFEENWQDSTGNGFNLSPVNTPVFNDTERAKDGDIGSNTSTCYYTGYENDQYAIAPNTDTQSNFNEITVSAWVNPTSYNASLSTIFSKSDDFSIYLNSAGNIQWQYLNTQLTSGSAVPLNQWTHIALTFKDGEQHIYINGVSAASASVAGVLIDLDENIYVAADFNSTNNTVYSDRYFQGTIDELRVYRIAQSASAIANDMDVLHPCDISITPDHYRIEHDGLGLTCEAETVTIKACNDALCTESGLNEEPKTVNFLIDGVISSSFTFTKKTTISFDQKILATVALSVTSDVNSPSINGFQCVGGEAATPCNMVFNDAELKFLYNNNIDTPIENQIAGEVFPKSLHVKAVENNNGTCVSTFNNKTVNIGLSQENSVPSGAAGLFFYTNSAAIGKYGNYTNVALTFDNEGKAIIPNARYDDAGQIRLHAKYSEGVGGANLIGVSNNFWVSPAMLRITTAVSDLDTTPLNNNTNSGTPTIVAGKTFKFNVTAYNAKAQSNFDNSYITQNYTSSNLELSVQRVEPTGTDTFNGEFSLDSGASNSAIPSTTSTTYQSIVLKVENGQLQSDAKYSEVGLLKVDIQDFEYGGIANTSIPSSGAIDVGRFIPDHFDVSIDTNNGNGSFENACELGAQHFTYTGQKFTYQSAPKLIINAMNADGGITQNYTHTDYRKLKASETNIKRTFPLLDEDQKGADLINNVDVDRTSLAGTLSISKDPADKDIHGSLTYTFNKDDEFTYTKNTNSKIGEFSSKYIITLESVKDSDNVSDTSGNQSSTSLPLSITPAQIRLRYGRLALNDNFGPETSDLPINLFAQYWDGTQFIVNTDDQCTSVDSGKLKVTGFSSTAVKTKASEDLVKGATQFVLRAPGAGNRGAAELEYETILMPWLQYDWQGDGSQLNPQANAVFGIYRGNDRVIYWREVFR
ncbi:DUF6701 domain-containing protein [Colwellia sp. RE-S-Sl-9]